MSNTYLSVEEVARELDTSVSTVKRWLRKKALPGYKFGKAWKVRPEDLIRFKQDKFNQNQNKPT